MATWSILRWTKSLTRSAARLQQVVACTSPVHQSRPLILTRLYSLMTRPANVLSPAGRPLQSPGANPIQSTARSLLPQNGTIIQPCRLIKKTYRPSNLKRKNKHGLHARLKTRGGIKLIMRRMLKGRYLLTH